LRHGDEIDRIVADFIAKMDLAEALAFFDKAEVTVGPIYDISQLMEDDYIAQRAILANYPDEQMGEIAMHCVVPRLKGTPGAIRKAAPTLVGEDNAEVLGGLGIDGAEIERLAADDAIYRGPVRKRAGSEE
jgi:formyl-CoA transferase